MRWEGNRNGHTPANLLPSFELLSQKHSSSLQSGGFFCKHPVDPWILMEGMVVSATAPTAGAFLVADHPTDFDWCGSTVVQAWLEKSAASASLVRQVRSGILAREQDLDTLLFRLAENGARARELLFILTVILGHMDEDMQLSMDPPPTCTNHDFDCRAHY